MPLPAASNFYYGGTWAQLAGVVGLDLAFADPLAVVGETVPESRATPASNVPAPLLPLLGLGVPAPRGDGFSRAAVGASRSTRRRRCLSSSRMGVATGLGLRLGLRPGLGERLSLRLKSSRPILSLEHTAVGESWLLPESPPLLGATVVVLELTAVHRQGLCQDRQFPGVLFSSPMLVMLGRRRPPPKSLPPRLGGLLSGRLPAWLGGRLLVHDVLGVSASCPFHACQANTGEAQALSKSGLAMPLCRSGQGESRSTLL